ncbi:uncharacterized protein EV422DRAFT_257137 [Fimicolochytrium jonesii]|uniref:uncharacterized protein n=1 Tax=Fimicolochytrium jonesii TaxID=1396493 RepID=UPI0022FE3597|nr:uncharacterized protein EV422DRAFT_257137 [Fimicolochytrium jonesii]KAI8817144.1 hypothetical protein EV422DRAFT_257137 [Fimicolochytrium jonesii]
MLRGRMAPSATFHASSSAVLKLTASSVPPPVPLICPELEKTKPGVPLTHQAWYPPSAAAARATTAGRGPRRARVRRRSSSLDIRKRSRISRWVVTPPNQPTDKIGAVSQAPLPPNPLTSSAVSASTMPSAAAVAGCALLLVLGGGVADIFFRVVVCFDMLCGVGMGGFILRGTWLGMPDSLEVDMTLQ